MLLSLQKVKVGEAPLWTEVRMVQSKVVATVIVMIMGGKAQDLAEHLLSTQGPGFNLQDYKEKNRNPAECVASVCPNWLPRFCRYQ